jgi:hypothetical protein
MARVIEKEAEYWRAPVL